MWRTTLLLSIGLAGWTDASLADDRYIGSWVGEARTSIERTRLVLHIEASDTGLAADITLHDVGVTGWPAQSVEATAEGVTLTIPSDSGPQIMVLQLEGTRLRGEWRESRFEEPARVELTSSTQERHALEQRTLVEGPAGVLGTSLIVPPGIGPFPGVVFLHGSGPQPRDSSRFAATVLASHGIASAIFDKRGAGDSEGDWVAATFADLAADGVAVAEYLLADPRVSNVGFFGHSQGGWIGPLAGATWSKTAFVITSSGPVVPPARETHWGVVRRLRRAGHDDSAEREARRILDSWNSGIRTGKWAEFDRELEAARSYVWFASSGLASYAVRPNEDTAATYRAFMDYDPLPTLRALSVPLLAILAPEDESIDAVESENLLRDLIAQGREINLKTYPGYDHSLRTVSSDVPLRWPSHPADYFDIQATFIRGVLNYEDARTLDH